MKETPPREERELFLAFSDEIDAFYRAQFCYKTRCAHPRFPTVDVRRVPVRLYLRFRPGGFWPEPAVVIAAIEFRDQRKGHGAALLSKLVDMSGRYGFRWIGIEQAGSGESIQNFVRKFHFDNHRDKRNWLVSVDELRERLSVLSVPTAAVTIRPTAAGRGRAPRDGTKNNNWSRKGNRNPDTGTLGSKPGD